MLTLNSESIDSMRTAWELFEDKKRQNFAPKLTEEFSTYTEERKICWM